MFEKYNEKARRALFFARYEASKLGSRVIESEHILLGVLREGEEIIKEIFSRFNIKPEQIRREVEGDRLFVDRISSSAELPLSEEAKKILAYASHEAESMLHQYVGTEHLLIGILRVESSTAARILTSKGLNVYGVREETISILKEREADKQKKELPFLAEYARDLTQMAHAGTFDPLIGREKEVDRIIQILSRRTKNNPILLGEPGVGKTAIVEGLAQRIIEGNVPLFIANKRILSLDLSLIVAGTKYRGQFEERLKGIIKELKENNDIIIFIDEIHSLIGAGSAEGSLDAANILKPALSRGEISCIGATTIREYRRYIEKDRSLLRRFQAINVVPPSEDETFQILEGLKERYESFHKVKYSDQAIKTAVYQSNRYITDRFFPDKAIDILDEAGAKVKLRRVADTQNLRRLEAETRGIVKEMKKAMRSPTRISSARSSCASGRSSSRTRSSVSSRSVRTPAKRRWKSPSATSKRSSRRGPISRSRRSKLTKRRSSSRWKRRSSVASSVRTKRSRRSLAPSAVRGSVSPRRTAPSARSSSSVLLVSGRLKSHAGWRSFSSGRRNTSSASICRSTWRSTLFRS
jgi:ATP-dependent Clp protease ATP-binding subunit ClpC